MKDNVEKMVQRTYRLYYEDGLVEMGMGIVFTLSGLILVTWYALQDGGWLGALLAVSSALLVIGGVFGMRWAVRQAKEEVTYPRTGYATYREGEPAVARWLILVVLMGVVTAGLFLPAALERMALMEGALLGAILIYLGYRLGLLRFYVLGVLIIAIGLAATYLFPDDLLGSAMTFGGAGLLLLLSGLVTFATFLRRHPEANGGSYE
jgi:hypothetical protein